MRCFLCAIKNLPHPEERLKAASRRTHHRHAVPSAVGSSSVGYPLRCIELELQLDRRAEPQRVDGVVVCHYVGQRMDENVEALAG
jgi:hypothetical protein